MFPAARVADAFRSMAQAKHIGKLIVSMQDNEGLVVDHGLRSVTVAAESYLITGGLGGLGLAVADRLARRGARHLALVGRSAPRPRRPRWRAYASAASRCSSSRRTSPIASRREVVAEVRRRMGPLRGVMHAAMVLDDASIERLTEERMWKAMAPKIMGAWVSIP